MIVAETLIWITLVGVVLYYFKSIKSQVRVLYWGRKLPGPKGNWFSNLGEMYTTPDEMFKLLRKYGRTYRIYHMSLLPVIGINILEPEDCELIMSNPKHINKSSIYNLLHDWLGTGLLTSSDAKWQNRRKILTPAFHFSILQQFVPTFNEETDQLVDILEAESQKPHISITSHITQFTLKTIAETAMGTKLHFNSQKELNYKQAITELVDILLYRLMRPWLHSRFVHFFSPSRSREQKSLKILHQFTGDVIAEREANFKDVELPTEEHDVYLGKRRLAMLDLMLLAKNKDGAIDSAGIREEVDTFMFEGHDTTSMALCFAIMLLACHKNAQEQIVQEMLEVLGDLKKKPSYNDLQEMKFLERCLKETLRLYPSVPFISRELGEDLTTHSGYKLAKSSITHIHIFDLHHNPAIYPDPEKFDPDRFLPENSQNRHTFAYLPFSAGPRNCIGQRFAMLELKAAICGILANFILEPVDTPDTIVLVVDIVLRTKDPIRVKFIPRLLE